MVENANNTASEEKKKMYITWQTLVTGAAVLGAAAAFIGYYNKAYTWVQKQDAQDVEIKAIKEEQVIITHSMLACLKGLKEIGCNGPVTEAINMIEEHLNKGAHR